MARRWVDLAARSDTGTRPWLAAGCSGFETAVIRDGIAVHAGSIGAFDRGRAGTSGGATIHRADSMTRPIASVAKGRTLAITHNLGGSPGDCVSIGSVIGTEPSA